MLSRGLEDRVAVSLLVKKVMYCSKQLKSITWLQEASGVFSGLRRFLQVLAENPA